MPTNDNPPHRPAGRRPPLIVRPTRLYRGVLGKSVPPLAERIRRRLPRITFPQLRLFAFLAVLGPGIITASADNDAGGITTYSIAGAQFGYGLLWLLLLTTFSLGITQEMGARMGIVTGKGLAALIREKFGIRWTGFAMLALLIANFGSTAADIAGVGAAMEIFGVSKYISVPIAVAFLFLLVFKGSFRWVERIFLVSAALYIAYIISGIQAHPDWGAALHNTVVPSFELRRDYIVAFIATIGTTITPWGQFFIQSYCVDKQLRTEDLNLERGDVYFGTFVTNFIAFFIVVATAATLFVHGQSINSASDAAQALAPLAGRFAALLFAIGLLNAAVLGSATLPLSTAYATSEAFGMELGLNQHVKQAPFFYGIYSATLLIAALFVLLPGIPLIGILFLSQMVNGILLPIILIFVLVIINDKRVMGKYTNGFVFNAVTWVTVVALIAVSLLLIPVTVLQQINGG